MERRARRSGSPAVGGADGKRGRAAQRQKAAPGAAAAPGGYFTAELAVLFLCLTALLVFLPLVLPPLPPPPLLLLLVPVGLMAVLLALAFVSSDGRSSIASPCL